MDLSSRRLLCLHGMHNTQYRSRTTGFTGGQEPSFPSNFKLPNYRSEYRTDVFGVQYNMLTNNWDGTSCQAPACYRIMKCTCLVNIICQVY